MKVLVTGGAGFIGSHICLALLERGHDVAIVDDLSSGRVENLPEVKKCFYRGNVISPDFMRRVVEIVEPEVIIHEAAQPSLLTSVERPEFDALVNIIGTINTIQASRKVKAHVVFASTSAVYDADDDQPYAEASRKRPTRPYGIAKLSAEMYLRESGIGYTVLRYGNVYGPRQVPVGENQLVPHALNHIFKGAPFVVNGDGEQSRDFVYAADVAEANVLAAEKKVNGIFNVATGEATSVNVVLAILGNQSDFLKEFEYGPSKSNEPRSVALDSSMAKLFLGWEAKTELERGLAETVEWYRTANHV